ncbi:hypothetical protein [Sphingopyxis fribergensis]|nr:hypothetical protein [Sphingopyxis fribergensis]
MRALLISSAFVAAFASSAPAVAAPTSLLPTEPEAAQPSSRLVPLAADSAWMPRFAAAADKLAEALRSRDEAQWAPLLGGQWLSAADRARVRNLLGDRNSPFLPALLSEDVTRRVILGWNAPASLSAEERAAIEAGPEAEALVCWSAGSNDTARWPETAVEADNRAGRSYACARIAYSIRGETPSWRAFIEQREPA